MPKPGLQPGFALHSEQPQVSTPGTEAVLAGGLGSTDTVMFHSQHCCRFPAHLHVLPGQPRLRGGADSTEEPA